MQESQPEQSEPAPPTMEEMLDLIRLYRQGSRGPWITIPRRDPLLVQKIRDFHNTHPDGVVLVSGEGDNERGATGVWMRTGPNKVAVGIFSTADAGWVAMAHTMLPAMMRELLRLKDLENDRQKETTPALPSTNTEAASSEGGGPPARKVKVFEPPPKGGGAVLE